MIVRALFSFFVLPLLCFAARPDPPLNGLLVDPARVPESPAYYRRLVDFARQWNLRALVFRIADDQGLAVKLPSHPELITHANALTAGEARELAEYARKRGIELIPEIESFGHTGYITRVPQYADLLDRDAKNDTFTGLAPVDPRSTRILIDLYRDAARIFPSPYLHGGCDEVNWGGSERSREALKSKTRAEIWAEYLNRLNEAARGLGKEFIVWGDHVLRKEPEILERLSKDVILLDWDYWTSDPAALEKTARKALASGFRVIGGPSLIWCKWGPRPGAEQLRNIDAYADAYRKIDDPRCLGVIVTNWLPSRYIQRSVWDGLAYAAVAVNEGSAAARNSAFRRFVERHYGAAWDATWADIFRTYYDIAPNRASCAPAWMRPSLPVAWSDEAELQASLKAGPGVIPPFTRLLSQMTLAEPSVMRNLEDFRAFRLSAEYLEQLYWRIAALAPQPGKPAESDAAERIRAIAERDARLLKELEADWDASRPPDSPIKSEPLFDCMPEDQLLFRFAQASRFSSRLASRPERFLELAKPAR
jgi:hypothetical protein